MPVAMPPVAILLCASIHHGGFAEIAHGSARFLQSRGALAQSKSLHRQRTSLKRLAALLSCDSAAAFQSQSNGRSYNVDVKKAGSRQLGPGRLPGEVKSISETVGRPLAAAALAELCLFASMIAYRMTCMAIPVAMQGAMRVFTIGSKLLLAPVLLMTRVASWCTHSDKKTRPGQKFLWIRPMLHSCIKRCGDLHIGKCFSLVFRGFGLLLTLLLRPVFLLVDLLIHVVSTITFCIAHGLPFLLPVFAAVAEYHSPGSIFRLTGADGMDLVRQLLHSSLTYCQLPFAPYVLTLIAMRAALTCNEGLARSMVFNSKMVPLALEYRFYQWLLRPASNEEKRQTYARLHARYVPNVLAAVYKLRGFYVKIGQVISSFGDSFIPTEYVDALKVLQDKVPPQPPKYIKKVVEAELKAPIDDVFRSFDLETPLGAASIGQVHAATLHNGLDVVVKLQYPDAEKFFRNDMECLKAFCAIFAPENVKLMEEIEKQFITEFDYRLEAELLRQAATNLMPHFPQLVIPLPIDAAHPKSTATLCTERCLVMERLYGASLIAAQTAQLERLAALTNTTAEQLRRQLETKFKSGQLKKPVLPTSFLIYFYSQYLNTVDAFCNIGNVLLKKPMVHTRPPINGPKLIDLLFDVHGHQLLHDGFFNGDAHPGNIMLLDDGRVGLIDWGQVKRIGREERVKLARLFIALADRDQVLTAKLWADCGFATQHMDPWCLDKWATWRFSRFTPDVTDIFDGVLDFEKRLGSLDPLKDEPQNYVMAFRLSALMRGAAMGLGDLSIDSAKKWRRQAVQTLQALGEPIPDTKRGRRLPPDEFLVKTQAMRELKPTAVKANSIF